MTLKKLFACVIVLVLMFSAASSSEASLSSEFKKLKNIYDKNKDKINKVVKEGQKAYNIYTGRDDGNQDDNSGEYYEEPPQQQYTKQQQNLQTLQTPSQNYGVNDRLIKSSTTNYPVGELENNLKVFARNILVNNQATFEIQLAQNELPRNAGTRLNKVCAKDKTITAGDSGPNKNYRPFCFMTADPYFTFAGGIRVGAPIRTAENFFVARAYDMAVNPGHLHFESNNKTYIDIIYDEGSGKIMQIGFYDTNGTNSNRTRSYMRQQAKNFGFSTMY